MPRTKKKGGKIAPQIDGAKATKALKEITKKISDSAAERMSQAEGRINAKLAVRRMKADMKRRGERPKYDPKTMRMERDAEEWLKAARSKSQ